MKTLFTDRCLEPYLPKEANLEDVRTAYRRAVQDVHPDVGGHHKALRRVKKEKERLNLLMEEEKEYVIEPKISRTYTYKDANAGKITKEIEENVSVKECWQETLEDMKNDFSGYKITNYQKIGEGSFLGVFSDSTKLNIAIETEATEENLDIRTTYFVDGYGMLDSFQNRIYAQKTFDLEREIQEFSKESLKQAERMKSTYYL